MTVNPDANPPAGGRWIRDPETGELSPAPEQEQQSAPDAQTDQE